MIACPACSNMLQPLPPQSSWVPDAIQHAKALDVEIPAPGPAALVFLALVAHAMILHSDLDLGELLDSALR